MEKSKKGIVGLLIMVVFLLTISIGLSFSYFTAILQGSETETTISVTGGTMKLIFSGGSNLTVHNVLPQAAPVTTKTFTVTGNNTTDLEMPYTLSLIVNTNSFLNNALSYTLTGTNTSSSGNLVPDVDTPKGIPTGTGTYIIGSGVHNEGSGKIHTYVLKIYFVDTGTNQNENQGKNFGAHIGIKEGETIVCEDCLNTQILAHNGGVNALETKGDPNYTVSANSSTSGMYAAADDYGMSYYFRGDKAQVKNNLIFAGFQWKIVRINGDGSIRLIYNGECLGDSCTILSSGVATQISGYHQWMEAITEDNKYLGYMYGGANGVPSVSRAEAVSNDEHSLAKLALDSWYINSIESQSSQIKELIADTIFCNDRQLQDEAGGAIVGTGIGDEPTYYAGYYRLVTMKNPTLRCGLQNDRFTMNDTVGNGVLSYPVGLISADELVMAGFVPETSYTASYLYTAQNYWTMTPRFLSLMGGEYMWTMNNIGALSAAMIEDTDVALRPVVNIKASALYAEGTGTSADPYRIAS